MRRAIAEYQQSRNDQFLTTSESDSTYMKMKGMGATLAHRRGP
jgi:hypothetical protein